MIALTAAIAVGGVISAVIFWRQLSVMQGQLDVMEADQRPWVSLAAIPTIASPLRYLVAGNWVTVDLLISLKNTGKTPARRVAIPLKMIGLHTGAGDLLAAQERVCLRFPKPLPQNAKYTEFTIFPGDILQRTQSVDLGKSDLDDLHQVGGHAVVSAIVGCIDYQFVTSEDHHQTGMIFDFLRKTPTPQANFGIDLDASPYQPDICKSAIRFSERVRSIEQSAQRKRTITC